MLADRLKMVGTFIGFRYYKLTNYQANQTSGSTSTLYWGGVNLGIDSVRHAMSSVSPAPTGGTIDVTTPDGSRYYGSRPDILIDMGSTKKINSIRWASRDSGDTANEFLSGLDIYGSHDQTTWALLAQIRGVTSPGTTYTWASWQTW